METMMNRQCKECGKELETTGDGPEWMNSYQWDAVKAGDYFAECENPTHPNGNCYFWKRSGNDPVRATPPSDLSATASPTGEAE
jgi:hypothetical protein